MADSHTWLEEHEGRLIWLHPTIALMVSETYILTNSRCVFPSR